MKKQLFFLSVAAIIGLSGCTNETGQTNVKNEKVTNEQKEGKENQSVNVKQLVHDFSVSDMKDQSASITSTQLIVKNANGTKSTYDLPRDEFFVSIAPYVNQTHPCDTHSLTGCQGELKNEKFNVHIEDEKGNVIVNNVLSSNSRGFIDFWLPRDKAYSISITQNKKTAHSKFSTFEKDNTCITSMQLK